MPLYVYLCVCVFVEKRDGISWTNKPCTHTANETSFTNGGPRIKSRLRQSARGRCQSTARAHSRERKGSRPGTASWAATTMEGWAGCLARPVAPPWASGGGGARRRVRADAANESGIRSVVAMATEGCSWMHPDRSGCVGDAGGADAAAMASVGEASGYEPCRCRTVACADGGSAGCSNQTFDAGSTRREGARRALHGRPRSE